MEPHPPATGEPQVIVSLDHCMVDAEECAEIRDAIHASTTVGPGNVLVTATHTHGRRLDVSHAQPSSRRRTDWALPR